MLERVGDTAGSVERELHACQIELITSVHASVGAAARELAGLRRAVAETGAALLGSGTHPAADEGDAVITDKERYERIHFLLGDAVVTPVGGLHIHVGMPDSETAVRVFNGLRRELPLLQALAANSPFRHGRDTGLASARELSLRGWPRSGTPRALRDFADFCEMSQLLARAADVPDYTWFWWKLRPHPRLGTVEIRALDVQASLADAGALIALVHCLAREAAERERVDDPPPEVLEEGMFRAARFGVRGELPDTQGRRRPVSNFSSTRWDGRMPGLANWDALSSSRDCPSFWSAAAVPACSAPVTRSQESMLSYGSWCGARATRRSRGQQGQPARRPWSQSPRPSRSAPSRSSWATRRLELLCEYGVDFAQGFYVARPEALDAIDLTSLRCAARVAGGLGLPGIASHPRLS